MICRTQISRLSDTPDRRATGRQIRSLCFLSSAAFFVFLLAPLATAQSQSVPEKNGDEVLKVRTDLITVPVEIVDRKGHPIQTFQKEDFQLFVDGHPTEIEYYDRGTRDLALMFALDQSGSVREIITEQRDAALELFRRFGRSSEVAVVRFDEQPHLVAPFSREISNAESAFSFQAAINHHTAIFDSIRSTLSLLQEHVRNPTQRKVIVVISDGLDTSSKSGWRDIADIADRDGISIYSIQIALFVPAGNNLEIRRASKGFREIAEKSGGGFYLFGDTATVFQPGVAPDMSRVFDAISADLNAQTILGFYPAPVLRDGANHTIEVRLKNQSLKEFRPILRRRSFAIRG